LLLVDVVIRYLYWPHIKVSYVIKCFCFSYLLHSIFSRFENLVAFGKTLLKQNPKAVKIRDNVVDLQSEYQTLADIWERRDNELHEDLDLLV
jgi:hypothetical protein